MGGLLSKFAIFYGDFADFSEIEDIYNAVMATLCVICAGLAAGLTMGLLSLDVTKLEIKTMTGTTKEKVAAAKILPIVKQHHLLLVTLLLFNSVANETLPIFLGALVPNYLAVIISVVLVLIFGEIIPSALFTGPSQLLTAARLTGLVYSLFALFYPIAFPLSKALDYMFGADENQGNISRVELEALVILQGSAHKKLQRADSIAPGEVCEATEEEHSTPAEGLSSREVSLMTGILKMSKYCVKDAMIPLKKVYMMSSSTRHDRQHLLGYLLVKSLIVVNPLDQLMVEDIPLREPLFVQPSLGLMEMLSQFQQSHCHLAVVSADPAASLQSLRFSKRPVASCSMLGIVTLEDVLEKIIQSDIVDETDISIYPSVFPNGGAPTVFYHNIMRPSPYSGKISRGQGKLEDNSVKKTLHRNLLVSSSSAVKAMNNEKARNYSTFKPREDVIHVLKRFDDTDTYISSFQSMKDQEFDLEEGDRERSDEQIRLIPS